MEERAGDPTMEEKQFPGICSTYIYIHTSPVEQLKKGPWLFKVHRAG